MRESGIGLDRFEPEAADRFYAHIGRVVADTALVELHLLYAICVLDRTDPEKSHGGEYGSTLLKLFKAELARSSDELREEGLLLAGRLRLAFERRNVIVHNVWPSPGSPENYGHRPLPASKRAVGGSWTADGAISPDEMDQLIDELITLLEGLMRFQRHAEAAFQRGGSR